MALNLSDTLRNHINSKVDEGFDFSLQSSRKTDLDNFILNNKSTHPEWKAKSIRPSYARILDECLKNKGIDPKSLGRQVKKPKFAGGMDSTITPKPVAGQVETPDNAPKIEGQQQAPIVAGAPQVQTQLPNPYAESFDEDGVGATFSAITMMFRLALPEFETLSEHEIKSLGKMWLPFFRKYMTENMAVVGIPLLATIGMLLPKIIKAKKANKINAEKKDAEKEKAKLDSDKKKKEEEKKND
jgi:hypothetical protein